MSTKRAAALQDPRRPEAGEEEEDSPMPVQRPVPLRGKAKSVLDSPHVRKPTRDLASLGLPPAMPVKMSLTESLMLDRGEDRLAR
jgi:hypothetical protein